MTTDLHRLFAGLEPDTLDRLATRRDSILSGGRLAAAFALSAVPLGLGAKAREAMSSSLMWDAAVNVLNFALTLEYLESTFYNRGISSGVIPGGKDRRVFSTIQDHENAHVAFLKKTLGSRAIAKPRFDFTAGGAIPNPFRHYEVFKILAQGFEDTGVRAYKGQLRALKNFDTFLTAAATIHSVEARHASEVRRLRGEEGWISFEDPKAPSQIKANYKGEGNLQQLTVNVGQFQNERAATEAFDEPLTKSQVLRLVSPFIEH